MARGVDLEMTVGDLRPSLEFTLKDGAGALVTLAAPTFHMVRADDSVIKINYASMVIVGPGVARYDWTGTDTNTAGDYYAWVKDITAGKPWHWPYGGREYLIRFTKAE